MPPPAAECLGNPGRKVSQQGWPGCVRLENAGNVERPVSADVSEVWPQCPVDGKAEELDVDQAERADVIPWTVSGEYFGSVDCHD